MERTNLTKLYSTRKALMLSGMALLSSSFVWQANAQQSVTAEVADSIEADIFFRVGRATVDSQYHYNKESLARFMARVEALQSDSLTRLARVEITSSASPEGSSALNKRLSDRRAAAIKKIIAERVPQAASSIEVESKGIDWDGLRKLVENSQMEHRDEVLNLIDNEPEWSTNAAGTRVERRKQLLKRLHNGVTWQWMLRNLFPELRYTGVVAVFERVAPPVDTLPSTIPEPVPVAEPPTPEPAPVDTVPTPAPAPVAEPIPAPEPTPAPAPEPEAETFPIALKTNLLYDAALVPAVGIEVPFAQRWSAALNWEYAWWKNDVNHHYWRVYGGDIAVRRWFGNPEKTARLQGHHVGVYGQIVTYDFELGKRGYLGPKWSWAAGLEYGYSFRLNPHLNLDLTIGAGYLTGIYKEYLPQDDCYVWQATKRRRWIGPTKAEISLVWILDINKNKLRLH
jgi:hypothetical protein